MGLMDDHRSLDLFTRLDRSEYNCDRRNPVSGDAVTALSSGMTTGLWLLLVLRSTES